MRASDEMVYLQAHGTCFVFRGYVCISEPDSCATFAALVCQLYAVVAKCQLPGKYTDYACQTRIRLPNQKIETSTVRPPVILVKRLNVDDETKRGLGVPKSMLIPAS